MPITYCIESDTDVDDIDYDNEKKTDKQTDIQIDDRQADSRKMGKRWNNTNVFVCMCVQHACVHVCTTVCNLITTSLITFLPHAQIM